MRWRTVRPGRVLPAQSQGRLSVITTEQLLPYFGLLTVLATFPVLLRTFVVRGVLLVTQRILRLLSDFVPRVILSVRIIFI